MEEIIKILEEHNIKCVWNGNDLVLSHKNFYVNVEDIQLYDMCEPTKTIEFITMKVAVRVYYTLEYIHITVL